MNIIFMRHGEATDNVEEVLSDREIYWSTLTDKGRKTVEESLEFLPKKIDKIYVSPFPRTIETSHFVYEKYSTAEVVIEERLHEIKYGKYSGKKNNLELDETRMKQIAGDYFVRFGEYGENKFEIETRLSEFLVDVYKNNFNDNTIMIVSHGSITSYMKRILSIKSEHIKTGKVEEFLNVDFEPLFKYMKRLEEVKNERIEERLQQVESLNISSDLKERLREVSRKEFNNVSFSNEDFFNFIEGLNTNKLMCVKNSVFTEGIILVCFYNNFASFVEKWMNHYIDLGIKNFVMIDNNSEDGSTSLLEKYADKVNISFWKIEDEYNFYKMNGWRQQILEFYGKNKDYLIVHSNELFVYQNYKTVLLKDYLKLKKVPYIKSLVLNVYSKDSDGNLDDFKFVDKETYRITNDKSYGQSFYGGPEARVLGVNSLLQKIPFISYTGRELLLDEHFYYPWEINNESEFCTYLLNYEFFEKYKNVSFYDNDISILIDDIAY